jgi:hypothetical protein
VDSGVAARLIDGDESMTLQLDNSVGASWISFNWTGGSGRSTTIRVSPVNISVFKAIPRQRGDLQPGADQQPDLQQQR